MVVVSGIVVYSDDCCKGFDFLWELAWVYDTIKRLDPYHLTAGFAECGELHAFQEPHLSLDAPIRENVKWGCFLDLLRCPSR